MNLIKRERIRRRNYNIPADAREIVLDYIEMLLNPECKHVRNGMLSPLDFERQQKLHEVWLENWRLFMIDF